LPENLVSEDQNDPLHTSITPCQSLTEALVRYGVDVPSEAIPNLERYAQLLWEWNEKINLTRHTDFDKFVLRDLVDTIQLSKLIHANEEVLDIGSGGGVPGLTLAILRPDLDVTLAESTQKKANVLKSIAGSLKLPVRVEAERAEKVLEDDRFDATTARGVGALDKLLTLLASRWLSVGRLLAFKGPKWAEEKSAAQEQRLLRDLQVKVAAEYSTPGGLSDAVILKIWPKQAVEK
jgi:16S rRNA (guanine527-N7)-methyltransferase